MKRNKICFALTLVVSLMCSTAVMGQTKILLTKYGVSLLKLNMEVNKIPEKVDGLYDRFEKKFIEDDYNGNYTEYTFYAGNDVVVRGNEYDRGRLATIIVLSPKIATRDGIHPGMSLGDVLSKPGVEASYNEGRRLIHKGIVIDFPYEALTDTGLKAFDDAYLKGTDVVLTKECFTKDGKVESIMIF
jgi:hypothetical protein